MSLVKIMLFGESKPVTREIEFDPDDPVAIEAANLRVSVTVGDDISGGTVVLPFAMLSNLIAQCMAEYQSRKQIIMPPNKIIKPN